MIWNLGRLKRKARHNVALVIYKLDFTIESEGKTRQNAENTQTLDLTVKLKNNSIKSELSEVKTNVLGISRTEDSSAKSYVQFRLPGIWYSRSSKISKCTAMLLHEQCFRNIYNT